MFRFFSREKPAGVPFGEQISILQECGIHLAVSPDALLESFDRETFESDPYRQLLMAMGSEAETDGQSGPHGYPSDDIWYFDTECIEDHGSYVRIAERLQQLAQGELPLEEIEDYVDLDEETAYVAFRLSGKDYRWDAEAQDDCVDPTILSRFAELLHQTGRSRRFTYIDLGGQDCLIGCATPAERSVLRRRTGLGVTWLD